MVVFIMALMLALSIALAVGAIHCNNTVAQGHWAKQDLSRVLLYMLYRVAPGVFVKVIKLRYAATMAFYKALNGLTPWHWLRPTALSHRSYMGYRLRRKTTGSHRQVMARWSCRRKFKPVTTKTATTDLRMWVSAGPSRKVRRERAGVRALFLSKLAVKRAEEKLEVEAVEAALAAFRQGTRQAMTEAKWSSRAVRRAEAGRTGKLGAVTETMKFSVRKYRNESVVVKTTPQVSRPAPKVNNTIPKNMILWTEKVTLGAKTIQAVETAKERQDRQWAWLQREAVKMGVANPIVTKRPVAQEIVLQATVLPVLAEYMNWVLSEHLLLRAGIFVAGAIVLAALLVPRYLKFIKKSKTNIDFYEGYEPSEEDFNRWEGERKVAEMQEAAYAAECEKAAMKYEDAYWEQMQEEDPDYKIDWEAYNRSMDQLDAMETGEEAIEVAPVQGWTPEKLAIMDKYYLFRKYEDVNFEQWPEDADAEEYLDFLKLKGNGAHLFSFTAPIVAEFLGLDLVTAIAAGVIVFLISRFSSFGGFALAAAAAIAGIPVMSVQTTKQETNSMETKNMFKVEDGAFQMIQEDPEVVEIYNSLKKTETQEEAECLYRTIKPSRLEVAKHLEKMFAMAMIALLKSKYVIDVPLSDWKKAYECGLVEVTAPADPSDVLTHQRNFDAAQKSAIANFNEQLEKMRTKSEASLFENVSTASMLHIHRAPTSNLTLQANYLMTKALGRLKKKGNLKGMTAFELAQCFLIINLVHTNFGYEALQACASRFAMVNAVSKTPLSQYLEGKWDAAVNPYYGTDIFLWLPWQPVITIGDKTGTVGGKETASLFLRIAEFTSVQKAAKAQKYINQALAPNQLAGKVISADYEYLLTSGKGDQAKKKKMKFGKPADFIFSMSSFPDAKSFTNDIYDGVVMVTRELMAVAMSADASRAREIMDGKWDFKVVIGRACDSESSKKGGFVVMPPIFWEGTKKHMYTYGEKQEIVPVSNPNDLLLTVNSGVPKTMKSVCTDTQSIINAIPLDDPKVREIFSQMKDDAVEWLGLELDKIKNFEVVEGDMDVDKMMAIIDVISGANEVESTDMFDEEDISSKSQLSEVIAAFAMSTQKGIALPQLVAPIINQKTNETMDPSRTRMPLNLFKMIDGVKKYCKIAYRVYPQVHYGLAFSRMFDALGIKPTEEQKALFDSWDNFEVPKETLKELKDMNLKYDKEKVIFCSHKDKEDIMKQHGSSLVFFMRNPSTFTSGAWGVLVACDWMTPGTFWCRPTAEAFAWFFKRQDGADLDDAMAMVCGELAKACIRFHEGNKGKLISSFISPYRTEAGRERRQAILSFVTKSINYLAQGDSTAGIFGDTPLGLNEKTAEWLINSIGLENASRIICTVDSEDGEFNFGDFIHRKYFVENRVPSVQYKTGSMKDTVETIRRTQWNKGLDLGMDSYRKVMSDLNHSKQFFSSDPATMMPSIAQMISRSSPLAIVDSCIDALKSMKGTTGTAANVQMFMGAIAQGLIVFDKNTMDLDANIRPIVKDVTLPKGIKVTYRDLVFLVMSEMLSDVIDADTQGQNVESAAEIMQMIWAVSMYLGIACFTEGLPRVNHKVENEVVKNMASFTMKENIGGYLPPYLMKRAIGALAVPLAGLSEIAQKGDDADPHKIQPLHFTFRHKKVNGAITWLFPLYDDYQGSVLDITNNLIRSTYETVTEEYEQPNNWAELVSPLDMAMEELGLNSVGGRKNSQIQEFTRLNKSRQDAIAKAMQSGADKRTKLRLKQQAEQNWLEHEWSKLTPVNKLAFAMWTISRMISGASAQESIRSSYGQEHWETHSWVRPSQRSFGSVSAEGLPTQALYTGNLLTSEGKIKFDKEGRPLGPWFWTIVALNKLVDISHQESNIKLLVALTWHNRTEEQKEWASRYWKVVNGNEKLLSTDRFPTIAKYNGSDYELPQEVIDAIAAKWLMGETLTKLIARLREESKDNLQIGRGYLSIDTKGAYSLNKRYESARDAFLKANPGAKSTWRDLSPEKKLQFEDSFSRSYLDNLEVVDFEVVYTEADLEKKKPLAHPKFVLHLSNTTGAPLRYKLPEELVKPKVEESDSAVEVTEVEGEPEIAPSRASKAQPEAEVKVEANNEQNEQQEASDEIPVLGIIGTAGRQVNLELFHYKFMTERTKQAIANVKKATGADRIRVVSGGAAWADHVAITMFLLGEADEITLHLPAHFKNGRYQVKNKGESDAGSTANMYHEKFSRVVTEGKDKNRTLATIGKLIAEWEAGNPNIHITFKPGNMSDFKKRNSDIARDADFLLAYTLGEGKIPANGGTKDTWDKFLALGKNNVSHVSLLGVGDYTPPTPPAKAEPAPKSKPARNEEVKTTGNVRPELDLVKLKPNFKMLGCSFPCPLEIPFKELASLDGFPNGVDFDSVRDMKFSCAETMYQWIKAEVMWPLDVNPVNPSDTAEEARSALLSMYTESKEDPYQETWDELKVDIMTIILEEKFNNLPIRNMSYVNFPALLVALTESGTKELKALVTPFKEEHDLDGDIQSLYYESAEPDHFWGLWEGKGENQLGILLTIVATWDSTKNLAQLFAEGTHTLIPS